MKKIIINMFIVLGLLINQSGVVVQAMTQDTLDENSEQTNNVTEEKKSNKKIQVLSNAFGNPDTCEPGVSTIADCFSDLVWAHAIAKKAGAANLGKWTPDGSVTEIPKYDVDAIFTQAMIDRIVTINGNSDLAPFVYKDANGVGYMPKMDGLGILTKLKTITNFGTSSSSPLGAVKWSDEGITDLSKWSEAKSLETISNIHFGYGTLTTIDLGSWGDLPLLKVISNVNFPANKLTTLGDLGNWGNATSLEEIRYVNLGNNLLTNVGDLGDWKNLENLLKINSLVIQNNQLTTLGDLGEWSKLAKIESIDSIWFGNNKLTNIGDLGRWKNLTTLKVLSGLSFHTNQITTIGDLGEWSALTNLDTLAHISFSNNKLTDIGDLGRWSSIAKLKDLSYISFDGNQLTSVGDLGEWSKLTNLTSMTSIYFHGNRITSIGDLGRWSNLTNLTRLGYMSFASNRLTDIGDLGEWDALINLQRLNAISFSNNRITSIGDLGRWSKLASLTELTSISASNNLLTDIGDLGEWSKLTNLKDFGSISFSNNQLTNIGDLGRWKSFTNLKTMKYIEFRNNKLTDIGDIGEWAELPNLTEISHLEFNGNQLTNIGDLGKWGNITNLTRIWQTNFYNNQLTDIGDLSNWKNLQNLNVLQVINFSSNKLTDIGNISEWSNIPNISAFIQNINFSGNKLETVTIDDAFASQTFPNRATLFTYTDQEYAKRSYYFNKNGLSASDTLTVTVPAHNAFNHPSGAFGDYTLTPDIDEVYKDSSNNILTVDNSELAVPFKVGATAATYTIEQKNHIPFNYSAKIMHPLLWIDLSIEANDFSVELADISTDLNTDEDVLAAATTVVNFIDEFGVKQDVIAEVNADEYTAIKNATTPGTYPLTFSYEYQGIEVTKTIEVTVYKQVDVLNLNATDFSIELTDAATLTELLAKEYALVSAENETTTTDITSKVIVDSLTELTAIQEAKQAGSFPLTFSVEDNGITATKTIEVTIYKKPDVLSIDATDFSIELTDVVNLTNELAKANAAVQATNQTSGANITNQIIVDEIELEAINSTTDVGVFFLTFTVEDNDGFVLKTIEVTVYKNPDVLSLTATDFTIELTDANLLTDILAKVNASVEATNETTGMNITDKVTVDETELLAITSTPEAGIFPLTFSVEDNGVVVSQTINVTVYKNPDVLSLTATDFTIELTDASLLTDVLAIVNASVEATNETTGMNITDKVTVDETELLAITSATEAGILPLTFSVEDNGIVIKQTINVTIYKNLDILSIEATDFMIPLAEVSSLTEELAKDMAAVQAANETTATDISDNVKVNIAELTLIQTTTASGTYPLTFTVEDNGVTIDKTIQVTVYKEADVLTLTATDFSVELSEVDSLTSILAKEKAKVSATNETTGTDISEHVIANAIDLQLIQGTKVPGVFALTFEVIDNGVTIQKTIQVTVYKNPDVLTLKATDFSIELDNVSSLTELLAKDKAQVEAMNETTGTNITDMVTIDEAELTAIQTTTITGTFPLTFTVEVDGVEVQQTIAVIVYKNIDVLSITASDFTIDLADAATLTIETILMHAQASAMNETTQLNITDKITADTAELLAIQTTTIEGTFPLTLSVEDNGVIVTKEIEVLVLDTDVSLDVLKIAATNFTLNLNDASSLTENLAKNYAGVRAKNETSGADITDQIEVDSQELTNIQNTKIIGLFPLTFMVEDNGVKAQKTILVNISHNTPTPIILKLSAADFSMNLNDVTTLTDELAKDLAEVKAINETDETDITDLVTVDSLQLKVIQETIVSGVFPLTFSVKVADAKAQKTINVYITNPINTYTISAEDASLSITLLKELLKNDSLEAHVLDITNAKAMNQTTATEVTPLIADLSNFETTKLISGAKIPVTISYTIPEVKRLDEAQKITTTAIITLYDEDEEETTTPETGGSTTGQGKLPTTGESTLEILFIGALISILSASMLYLTKKVKNKTK